MEIELVTKAFVGGALIGLSAVLLMLFNGRIAGISGVLAAVMRTGFAAVNWQVYFLGGLLLAGVFWQVGGSSLQLEIESSKTALILGGLLVGFGTRLGSGCTSGHGVCGISRFSKRSIIATMTFIFTGVVTVTLLRIAGEIYV